MRRSLVLLSACLGLAAMLAVTGGRVAGGLATGECDAPMVGDGWRAASSDGRGGEAAGMTHGVCRRALDGGRGMRVTSWDGAEALAGAHVLVIAAREVDGDRRLEGVGWSHMLVSGQEFVTDAQGFVELPGAEVDRVVCVFTRGAWGVRNVSVAESGPLAVAVERAEWFCVQVVDIRGAPAVGLSIEAGEEGARCEWEPIASARVMASDGLGWFRARDLQVIGARDLLLVPRLIANQTSFVRVSASARATGVTRMSVPIYGELVVAVQSAEGSSAVLSEREIRMSVGSDDVHPSFASRSARIRDGRLVLGPVASDCASSLMFCTENVWTPGISFEMKSLQAPGGSGDAWRASAVLRDPSPTVRGRLVLPASAVGEFSFASSELAVGCNRWSLPLERDGSFAFRIPASSLGFPIVISADAQSSDGTLHLGRLESRRFAGLVPAETLDFGDLLLAPLPPIPPAPREVESVFLASGTVVDESGSPLGDAHVVESGARTECDRDGRFVLRGTRAGSPGEELDIEVDPTGSGVIRVDRTIRIGERRARLVVPRPPRLEGRVLVDPTIRVADLRVELCVAAEDGGSVWEYVRLASDGSFTRELPLRSKFGLRVVWDPSDELLAELDDLTAVAGPRVIDLRGKAHAHELTILDPCGAPVRDANVEIIGTDASTAAAAQQPFSAWSGRIRFVTSSPLVSVRVSAPERTALLVESLGAHRTVFLAHE